MKKTGFIELFNTIKKTKVTFIAIILFVTMGMALFFGCTWSGKTTKTSADDYFKTGRLADVTVTIPQINGFDNLALIEGLRSVTNANDVEGYFEDYKLWEYKEKTYNVRITSITEKINILMVVKGKVPEENGEIAIETNFASAHGIKINDTISLGGNNYTVTAFAKTAPYLNRYEDMYGISNDNVPVNCLMFAPLSSFSSGQVYSKVAIRSNSLRCYDYFSSDYEKNVEKLKTKIENYFNSIGNPDYAVLSKCLSTATDNSSRIALIMMADILDKLKFSMAGLFVIIGLLVSYFAVSRIVYENTVLIGTKKALGFNQKEITLTFLLYAGTGTIIGCIIGFLGARFIVEPIVLKTVKDIYLYNKVIYQVDFLSPILFSVVEISFQLLTVFIACGKILKKNTLSLLKGVEPPKAKKRFYEKTKLFNKLSLFMKTVVNNFFNDKRRVVSTLVGIASCAALVVSAITINNNILNSFDRQYDKIYNFDGIIYYDNTFDNTKIKNLLNENDITNVAEIFQGHVVLNAPSGKKIHSYVYVGNSEDVNKIISLYDKKGNKHTFDKGFWSSCSYQEEFDAKNGDTIEFVDMISQQNFQLKADGFFEYYLINNLFIMDAETFSETFHMPFKPNTIFFSSNGNNFNDLFAKLKADSENGFLYLSDDYSIQKESFNGFVDVFTIIVIIYLLLAVATAFLVLLNLFVMFVTEKKKELLTLLINGYSIKDAKRYIYLDTIILAVIGILLGLIFGTLMANVSLSAYNNETMHFISGIDLVGCLIGIGFTALLTFITCFMALRKIKTFKLTSANE